MAGALKVGAYALVGLAAMKGLSLLPVASLSDASMYLGAAQAGTAAPAAPATEPSATEAGLPEPAALADEAPGSCGASGVPEILADVAAQKEALATRTAALDQREAELDLARSALAEQNGQLAALRDEVTKLLDQADDARTADIDRLVKIYKAMKPEEAAAIMNDADMELAVLVVSAMDERSSGPIMAKMDPVRARAISRVILERARLPGDQGPVVVQLN